MSPRLIAIVVLVALVTASAVAAVWIVVPQSQESVPAAGEASSNPASHAQRREKFFGGDTNRDIRGGQEMRPRW